MFVIAKIQNNPNVHFKTMDKKIVVVYPMTYVGKNEEIIDICNIMAESWNYWMKDSSCREVLRKYKFYKAE